MKRHKNLERAIVLSLLMSSSIYGTVFAEDAEEIGAIVDDTELEDTYDNDVIVNAGDKSAIELESKEKEINSSKTITLNSKKYGIRTEGENTNVILISGEGNSINIKGIYNNGQLTDSSGDGINVTSSSSGTIVLTANKGNNEIKVVDDGIYVDKNSSKKITLTSGSTDNNITTIGNNEITAGNNGIDYRGSVSTSKVDTVVMEVKATGANIIKAGVSEVLGVTVGKDENDDGYRDNTDGDGIRTEGSTGTVKVEAGTYNEIDVRDTGLYIKNSENGSKIDLIANGAKDGTFGNSIYAQENGVQINSNNKNDVINVDAKQYGNSIIAEKNAVYNNSIGTITIDAAGTNLLIGRGNDVDIISAMANNNSGKLMGNGIVSTQDGLTKIQAGENNIVVGTDNGIYATAGKVQVTATKNTNTIGKYNDGNEDITSQNGINVSGGTVIVEANNNNIVYGTETGILASGDNSSISLTANNNSLYATSGNIYGDKHAIKASEASNVELNARDGDNIVAGVIYAKGVTENDGTIKVPTISLKHEKSGSNYIYSSAHGSSDDVGDRRNVVAALYAQNNGVIKIMAGQGGVNHIETNTTLGNGQTEQTVWAQQGGKIYIDGQTVIKASNAEKNTDNTDGNSLGIAITAGTGKVDSLSTITDIADEKRSTVNITNASGSSITGDIVSGYGGLINIGMDINNKTRNAGTVENIKINGNALAANGGKLNINLGNNSTWIGRADDYGDAGVKGTDGELHQEFYNPAFSNKILEGGTVNLTMGNNSTWYVNGQSWITSIDTSGAKNATIDLVRANTDKNTTAHALTIYDLKGNANINMSLDGNRDVSDMLYIKKAEGEYNIVLADAVTTADMYANGLNGLRFATVGAGSKVKFNAGSYDSGLFNVEYEVGADAYDGNKENAVYNGDSLDTEKPGTDNVDGFFGYQDEDPNVEEITNKIATYAQMAEEPTTETAETTKSTTVTGATNYKLIARKSEELSDAGKTILNMSKANYSQAVYLDTLNKRLGEARYLEGDEGLWIRMRHDEIDKDSSYEISNNMYQLGYDKKYESKDKNGYHRKGVAIDYMDGDTSYDDIAGSGETNRKGIWLYDTWIGNKGHYTDYVAKWGHLENSFDLYTKTRGEKVSGEYDNDVYSLSAEWGYKDQLNNDWYIEPQVQLQYARVTGADYETSQGTQVSMDGIDSLIARAGFRLGKDFGEEKKSTFYVKADVLHEFLGDQDITAMDKTTDGRLVSIGYDNDGTWYSVGLGFSTMLSDNSYAFLDVEKLFGNDNDNSYQINGGFNWLL